jgi:hypothetical protein
MIRRIDPEAYDELCRRLEAAIKDATPAESVIAVVSKGDPRLVEIESRQGLHFPADPEGRYVGYHPRTSEEAIAQVEGARRAGAEFLCLPATALWWLDHYQGFAAWLGAHCGVAARDPETCVIYDLLRVPGTLPEKPAFGFAAQLRTLLDSLLPDDAVVHCFGAETQELATPIRTVIAVEGDSAFGLRRRLESTSGRPTFVLVADNDSAPPLGPELEAVIEGLAHPIVQRDGLCVLFEINLDGDRSRISQSSSIGDTSSDSSSALGGAAAEKLSRRLQRLGLPGQDGGSLTKTPEVGK